MTPDLGVWVGIHPAHTPNLVTSMRIPGEPYVLYKGAVIVSYGIGPNKAGGKFHKVLKITRFPKFYGFGRARLLRAVSTSLCAFFIPRILAL